MATTHYIRLPIKFVRDREERALDCGETDYIGKQVLCVCDTETLKDMEHDAEYQANWTDTEDYSLKRSALNAYRKIRAYRDNEGI